MTGDAIDREVKDGADNPSDVMMTDMPLVKVWGEAGLLAPLDRGDWFSHRFHPARTRTSHWACSVFSGQLLPVPINPKP